MYDGDNSNLVLEQAHVLYCLRMVWLCMDMPTYIYIFTAIFVTPCEFMPVVEGLL